MDWDRRREYADHLERCLETNLGRSDESRVGGWGNDEVSKERRREVNQKGFVLLAPNYNNLPLPPLSIVPFSLSIKRWTPYRKSSSSRRFNIYRLTCRTTTTTESLNTRILTPNDLVSV